MKDRRRAETHLLTVYATLAQANSLCYKRSRDTNSRWGKENERSSTSRNTFVNSLRYTSTG